MPVGRIILKSISASRKLALLKTDGARLLYTWLIPHLNIHGCYEADPLVIRSHVLSRLDKNIKEIAEYLDDMESIGLIQRYEVNSDIYLFVPDFKEKQPNLRPEREGKTHIPTPTPTLLRHYSDRTPAQDKTSKVKLSKDREPSAVFNTFPINQLLGKLRKLGINPPDEVITSVGASFNKNHSKVKKPWPWLISAFKKQWYEYNAQKNIKESKELNQLSQSKEIRDLLHSISIKEG